jgi:hypothetical protein
VRSQQNQKKDTQIYALDWGNNGHTEEAWEEIEDSKVGTSLPRQSTSDLGLKFIGDLSTRRLVAHSDSLRGTLARRNQMFDRVRIIVRFGWASGA